MLAALVAAVLTRGAQEQFKSTTQLKTSFTITDQVSITEGKFNLYEIEIKFSNLIQTLKSTLVLNTLGYELLLRDLRAEEPYKSLTEEDFKNNQFLGDLDLAEAELVLSRKIDSLTLLDTYIPTEKRILKLLELYKYDPVKLREKFTIQRVNRTDYVSLTAITNNPNLSALMVNKLYEVYNRHSTSEEGLRTDESVQKWQVLVDQKKQDLDRKAEDLRRFKASNNLLNFEVESTSKIEQLGSLESDLDEERRKYRRLTLEIEDNKAKLDALDNGYNTNVSVNNTQILSLREKINALNLRYEASNRTNSEVADSLRILRGRLQNLAALSSRSTTQEKNESLLNLLSDMEIQLSLTEQNISSIESKIRQIRNSIGGFAGYEARVASLEKEVQLSSQEYLWAQEKYNQAVDIATASSSTVRQIFKGVPPTKAEPSKRLIVTALAGAVTFILCFVVAVLVEYIDTSIKSPSNFEREVSNLPLLGSVIKIAPKNGIANAHDSALNGEETKPKISEKILSGIKDKINVGASQPAGTSKGKDFFTVFEKSSSNGAASVIFKEQLRKIRYSLINSRKKVILFTSTKEGEGKTSMICALAAALNQSRLRVLIVDTNFSNPSLTKILKGLPIMEGIFENKKKSSSDTEKNFVAMFAKTTSLKYVDIFGCKGGEYTPIEIIRGNSLKSLIEDLKDKYDFIFFEGAALNTNSGSRELANYVEGVITVFSAKSALSQLDYDSIDFVEDLGDKNLGAIVNDVEIEDIKL